MADISPRNNTSFFLVLTGLVMALLILGPLLLLVRQRQSIPTVDDQRREQRLKNLADLNAGNQKTLTQYRWIDKNKGIVGIPIDQAMNLVLLELQANKAHPAGPVVTPSPAVKSSPAEKEPANQPAKRPTGPVVTPSPAVKSSPAEKEPANQPAKRPAAPVVTPSLAVKSSPAEKEPANQPAKRPAGPVVTPSPAVKSSPAQNEPANQPASGAQGGLPAGDPQAGEVIFKQCAECHSLEPDENKQGPSLAGIFGRTAGTVEDFNYSDANKNSGIVWDEAMLRKYLPDPQSLVPGTKMTFPGLKDPKQVEDVIAYLKEATKK
jgi:cytochrome c